MGSHGHKMEELYAGGSFCERLRQRSPFLSKSDQHARFDTLSPLPSAKPHELEDLPSLALW